jgi:hypothetical protein
MIRYNWEPWKTFERDGESLPIDQPPCPWCKHFNPARKFYQSETGPKFDGVQLCHAEEMHPDFSCFRGAETSQQRDDND